MDEKISLKALEDYSDDYASKVTASFFSSKEKISGPEILKVCDIHQINLFIIRELLHAWKLESHKLRSPFFDYAAPAVADAMTKFQNALSNNISISKENFQPLLKKAVHQTLFLILDPYDFYSETLDNGTGSTVRIDDLKNDIKYVKVNRVPLERLLKNLEEKNLQSISGNEAFALLDRILEEVNFTPEDIDDYIAKFSVVAPLSIEKLYDKKTPEVPVREPLKVFTPPPVAQNVPKAEPAKKVEPEKKPEEKKPAATQATLYDQPKASVASTPVDVPKRKKIKDTLTINQKFMFTKILFNGDFELFSSAIDRLDELDSLSQANSYLTNNYAEWNKEGEEYLEFIEIVEKRFN